MKIKQADNYQQKARWKNTSALSCYWQQLNLSTIWHVCWWPLVSVTNLAESNMYCTCGSGDSGVSAWEDSAAAEDGEETVTASSASPSPTTSCNSAWWRKNTATNQQQTLDCSCEAWFLKAQSVGQVFSVRRFEKRKKCALKMNQQQQLRASITCNVWPVKKVTEVFVLFLTDRPTHPVELFFFSCLWVMRWASNQIDLMADYYMYTSICLAQLCPESVLVLLQVF